MNKSFITRLAIIFMLFLLFTGTANAWAWGDLFGLDDNNALVKLQEIEQKKEALTENMRVMRFINSNMFDEGVDTVEISVKNKDQILKTYYIIRAKNRTDPPSVVESIPDQPGVLWKFRPTVDQALKGLDQASNGLLILDQKEKSKSEVVIFVLNALYLYYTVENENLPSLSEIIKKSSCGQCKKALSWAGFSSEMSYDRKIGKTSWLN